MKATVTIEVDWNNNADSLATFVGLALADWGLLPYDPIRVTIDPPECHVFPDGSRVMFPADESGGAK